MHAGGGGPGDGLCGGRVGHGRGRLGGQLGLGFGVNSVLDAVSGWVTSGAVWLLGQIGGVLSSSTAIDLGAPWFRAHYATMAALAAVVSCPSSSSACSRPCTARVRRCCYAPSSSTCRSPCC